MTERQMLFAIYRDARQIVPCHKARMFVSTVIALHRSAHTSRSDYRNASVGPTQSGLKPALHQ